MKKYPTIMSIAGSDCSGGAGIQADLKTISALGAYAATAITAAACLTKFLLLVIIIAFFRKRKAFYFLIYKMPSTTYLLYLIIRILFHIGIYLNFSCWYRP